MADYRYDPLAAGGGDGSEAAPFNTLTATVASGAHRFMLRAGRTYPETFTFPSTSNGSVLTSYGDGPLPVIDCAGTRATGVNLNSRIGCEVTRIEVINQNATAPDGGIRVSGSGHHVHRCRFRNNRNAIHGANTAGNIIEWNYIDVGNPANPGEAYAVRLSAVGCVNNIVRFNEVTSSAVGMTFMATLFFFGVGTGNRMDFNWVHDIRADGPSLRNGTSGCFMVGNRIHGARILDALVVEGSSGNFLWNNVAVNAGDVPNHFGPALKMGDEFGTGTPSANNDIANNVFMSLGQVNNVMNLVTIGTGNTFRRNRLWRPNGGNVVNLNTGSGTSALTFAAWQAAGFSTDEVFAEPVFSGDDFRIAAASELATGGVDVGYLTDSRGQKGRAFIGAFAPVVQRRMR